MNKKLLRAFKRSKLTAYRVAVDSGLSQSTVGRWLRGDQDLSIGNAEKIAKVLKVKLEVIQ